MRMTRLVVSFNRHFFAIAILSCVAAAALFVVVDHFAVRAVLAVGGSTAVYFMAASVMASYVTYDASDLYKARWWPARALAKGPRSAVLVHAGFDPASAPLRACYPGMALRVLDFFEPETTTEASIQRAHRMFPPSATDETTAAGAWPVDSASQDTVFALSAAHELRRHAERVAFFREARRVLRPGGRVIVIEQLRDAINFSCFGLAAFHFLARATWLRSFADAGLAIADEFKISPFMTAFVLQPAVSRSARPSPASEGEAAAKSTQLDVVSGRRFGTRRRPAVDLETESPNRSA